MGILFLIAFFIVSLFIVGLVLLQEGKGGGLTGMSTGMDGVMGAKNPLRRWTAYLFVIFVVMCLGINMFFHNREDTALPAGITLTTPPSAVPALPSEPIAGDSLRPEDAAVPTAANADSIMDAAKAAVQNVGETLDTAKTVAEDLDARAAATNELSGAKSADAAPADAATE